jgi:hypothetical protein
VTRGYPVAGRALAPGFRGQTTGMGAVGRLVPVKWKVPFPAVDLIQGAETHKAFCREVRAAFPAPGLGRDSRPAFRAVVAIVASSRGGSSLLFDLLRSTGAFLCLEGEHSTLYKLHGLGLPPDPDSHDGCAPLDGDVQGFLSALAADVTTGSMLPGSGVSGGIEAYATRVLRMLAQQWPDCPLSPGDAWEVVHDTTARLLRTPAVGRDRILLAIVRALRGRGWLIDPRYFDISATLIGREFPGMPRPQGPPPGLAQSLEAPPFLVPGAAKTPGRRDLRRPLLLKASVDAYRIAFLRQLFPDTQLRLIHLTRNPAAAINGMIDGWLHHGFFSHNLADRIVLDIGSYSGTGDWGTSWWNFDLPPTWRDLVTQPLVRVCAAQWAGAHTSIMANLRTQDAEVTRVRAEDVLDARRRPRALRQVLEFCGVRPVTPPRARIVLATQRPMPGRWRARVASLESVLADPVIRQCTCGLGYSPTATGDWT